MSSNYQKPEVSEDKIMSEVDTVTKNTKVDNDSTNYGPLPEPQWGAKYAEMQRNPPIVNPGTLVGLPSDGLIDIDTTKSYAPEPARVRDAPKAFDHNTHQSAASNIPDSFELFLLAPGEKKIREDVDTRTPNTSIFYIAKEDHTLANLLRAHLMKDPHVTFAGYKVPHPLFAAFELRVQTDGTISPKEAVVKISRELIATLATISREFTKEWELHKVMKGNGESAK